MWFLNLEVNLSPPQNTDIPRFLEFRPSGEVAAWGARRVNERDRPSLEVRRTLNLLKNGIQDACGVAKSMPRAP